ncbi:MAG: PAS domain S-box protein [Gammaproteobacteria bacterium]|nr:PAS domain S-box protein [Gammaproteobacteria bacterium]
MTTPSPPSSPVVQRELQALLDATVDAVILIDSRGHIESFNRAGERLFGYAAGELLGRNVSILMTGRDRDAHDQYMARYLNTGVAHIIGIGREVDARRKDGSTFPVFLSVGRVADADPPRFVGLLHDITLRREAMAAIRRERDRANLYLEIAQVFLLALSADRRVQLVNRKGCDILGRREMELLGQDWIDVAVAPAQQAAVVAEFEALAERPMHEERYFEHEVVAADGRHRLIAWRCLAMRNAGGELIGYFASGEDVTDSRRAAEDSALAQQRITQVGRLATMGEMAAGIAHELNQPLAAIANYANAALRLLVAAGPAAGDPDGDIRLALDQISAQAQRAGEIIRRLRALVQNRETRLEAAEVNELVNEVLGFLQSNLRHGEVRVERDLDRNLPIVLLDRIQVQQILLNLIRNAIEALADCPAAERRLQVITASDGADQLRIEIRDSGPGVPAELIERIFDPFCTTKATGTGLGLAISRTIAEAHQGKLAYEPMPGGGSRFVLHLPCRRGNAT